jgi:hypothetical protein
VTQGVGPELKKPQYCKKKRKKKKRILNFKKILKEKNNGTNTISEKIFINDSEIYS